MRPLSALPPEDARRLRGVLFDLDDTLLSHGVLELAAYEALWRLYDAGLALGCWRAISCTRSGSRGWSSA